MNELEPFWNTKYDELLQFGIGSTSFILNCLFKVMVVCDYIINKALIQHISKDEWGNIMNFIYFD